MKGLTLLVKIILYFVIAGSLTEIDICRDIFWLFIGLVFLALAKYERKVIHFFGFIVLMAQFLLDTLNNII